MGVVAGVGVGVGVGAGIDVVGAGIVWIFCFYSMEQTSEHVKVNPLGEAAPTIRFSRISRCTE
jgi:hypothetical protein